MKEFKKTFYRFCKALGIQKEKIPALWKEEKRFAKETWDILSMDLLPRLRR